MKFSTHAHSSSFETISVAERRNGKRGEIYGKEVVLRHYQEAAVAFCGF